jgi:shikimate dehydrogenase
MDRYVVIGNPVSHSLSPEIHAMFARETGEALEYARLAAPLGEFDRVAREFFAGGGRGANVTLPFKLDALRFARRASQRAELAGAANFLAARGGDIECDNTDGAGLVADLARNLGVTIRGARLLIVGAGGAARGVLPALLGESPARVVVANRTPARAEELASRFARLGEVRAASLDRIPASDYDLVINATSTSTRGETLAFADAALTRGSFAYDMAYGDAARPFLERAHARGMRVSDGLGMLVEQAAESFELWRGRRPQTAPVLAELRKRAR